MKIVTRLILLCIILPVFRAFPQKTARLTWEKDLLKQSAVNWYNLSPAKLEVSPSGNSLVSFAFEAYDSTTPGGTNSKTLIMAVDNNGNTLWQSSNLYKNSKNQIFSNTSNPNYMLLTCNSTKTGLIEKDSIFFFDRNYQLLKGFDVHSPNTYLSGVEDGVIYSDPTNTLIKYDVTGKEQWRFKNDSFVLLISSKAPYIGMLQNTEEKHQYIFLDKNGQRTAATFQKESFNAVFPTSDGGFWLETSNTALKYCKFDAIGNQTATLSISDLPAFAADGKKTVCVLPDNSFVIMYTRKDRQLGLAKVEPNGNIKSLIPGISIPQNMVNTWPWLLRPLKDNSVQYIIDLPVLAIEANTQYFIGHSDFDNSNVSWQKEIGGGASNGISGRRIVFGENDTFFQIYPRPDNPPLKYFKIYDNSGQLKWESTKVVNSPLQNAQKWTLTNHTLYASMISDQQAAFTKTDYVTGKELFSISLDVNDYTKDIQKDTISGKEYISYLSVSSTDNTLVEQKIRLVDNNGVNLWEYKLPGAMTYLYALSGISPYLQTRTAENDNFLALSIDVNRQTYTLRKLSPPCTSELTALAYSMGNTNPCPSEKVKLVIDKKEGFTYQWLKDNVNLSHEGKDAVQDVSESGIYKVVVTDPVCQQSAVSNEIPIVYKAAPSALLTVDTPKKDYISVFRLIATTEGNSSYRWRKDGIDISNATQSTYDATLSGTYAVLVTKEGCSSLSNSVLINILTPLATEKEEGAETRILPNPNNGLFKIEVPSNLKNAELQLFDSLGREKHFKLSGEYLEIDNPQNGIFYLKIYQNNKLSTQKIVVLN